MRQMGSDFNSGLIKFVAVRQKSFKYSRKSFICKLYSCYTVLNKEASWVVTLSALCGLGVATQSNLCPGKFRSHDDPFTGTLSCMLSLSSIAPIAGSLIVFGSWLRSCAMGYGEKSPLVRSCDNSINHCTPSFPGGFPTIVQLRTSLHKLGNKSNQSANSNH